MEDVDRETWLRTQLEETLGDIDAARESGRGWTALSSLRKLALETRTELDALVAAREAAEAREAEEAPLSDEELVGDLIAAVGELPSHLLGPLEDALAARRAAEAKR